MATKKKTKKTAGKRKSALKKRTAAKPAPRKSAAKKLFVKSKLVARKSLRGKTFGGKKKKAIPQKRVRGKSQVVDTVTFEPAGLGARSGGQSGDLQGLSNHGRSSLESVDELLEEGNSFEAEVVKGVEDAGDAHEREVHTHEVAEDDVPGEYLDKD
jgi:hypothetical protein